MAETATKPPVKTEAKAAAPAPPTLDGLRRQIDYLFEDFLRDWRLPFGRQAFNVASLLPREAAVAPAVDVVDMDKVYVITAELPGMDHTDIEVSVVDGTLTIKGEKQEEKEEKEKNYCLSERRYGSFQRSFQVPDGVDADNITADFSKGILTVTLPKIAEAQKPEKKITVQAA